MEYHKINSVYKRTPDGKTMLLGAFAQPEFEYLASNVWVFTEKVDGTNIRVMVGSGGGVTFGGKTDKASIPSKLFARLCERFINSQKLHDKFPDGAVLYGEGYGAGIQKGGGNYRADQDFVLFDVRVGEWWLGRSDVVDVATTLGIDVVPVVGLGTLAEMAAMVSGGFVSQFGLAESEGIVARPQTELRCRDGRRVITKLKTKDFANATEAKP